MSVVHCKREHFDVYIGRPSKWGNPFVIGRDGTREEVIAKYEKFIRQRPDLVAMVRKELNCKVLGCWCSPLPCHGDVLARIADEEYEECEDEGCPQFGTPHVHIKK